MEGEEENQRVYYECRSNKTSSYQATDNTNRKKQRKGNAVMKKIVVFIILIAALSLSACGQITLSGQNFITGSGKMATEARQVSGFNQIALNGQGSVKVVVGDQESLTINAEDNLMKYIQTEVKGSQLVLSTTNGVQLMATKPINYTVTVKSANAFSIAGSGNITMDTFQTDHLDLSISGSGTIQVTGLKATSLTASIGGSGSIQTTGKAASQVVTIPGSGTYTGTDLKSSSAEVTISGSGSAIVWASDTLKATISGSGNIIYYDSPTLNQMISGSGKITGKGSHS